MKNLFYKRNLTFVAFILVATLFSSCVHVHHPRPTRTVVVKHKRVPPGQAKKISGDRSARRHAHGNH
ncbi:hypothetical protein [Flavobacterium terrae]|uniref:Quinol oxidase subunit 4 n=1 Tax=Flavobacterium terrae TaxID=415425 RepID=A0A1M6B5S4_9FLAO|nr:hypothetical protein [Flavobacterium terrae]SHI44030.1 hypothetical protein SAMN05444363_0570 [Flavobacterium terrae]